MPTRTEQLARLRTPNAAGTHNIYTCPADRVTIIKEILWTSPSALSTAASLQLANGGVVTALAEISGATPGVPVRLDRWSVLVAGDVVQFVVGTAASWHVQLSGAELVVPT